MKCLKSLLLTSLYFAAFCNFCKAAVVKLVPRIVNGDKAELGQFPHHAVFVRKQSKHGGFDYEPMCGGTIIADHWIITAAHCIKSLQDRGARGMVSTNNLGHPAAALVDLAEFIVHPDYIARTNTNDIALVKTLQSMGKIDGVVAAKLPVPGSKPKGKAIASGHGSTKTNSPGSQHLLHVTMEIVSDKRCMARYPWKYDGSIMICAGGFTKPNQKATCYGDSGGPFVQKNEDGTFTAIGATSYGPEDCAQPGFPPVFVRVSAYTKWIQEEMRKSQ